MNISSFFKKSFIDPGLLVIRVCFGAMILMRGMGKMERLISGSWDFADPIGIGSEASFILVTFAEFVCAVLLIMGLLTRFALIPLIITMFVVVFIHGTDQSLSDRERPVLFLIAFLGLFLTGPGKYSIDGLLFKVRGK